MRSTARSSEIATSHLIESGTTVVEDARLQVWLSDGTKRELEATHYEVNDRGELMLWGGTELVERLRDGSWMEIRATGTLLCEEWPYPRMHLLMDNLCDLLIRRYGGWLHGLGTDQLLDWRLNDLDAFLSAIFEGASLDPRTKEDRARVREVRRLVSTEFGLHLSQEERPERRPR